MASFQCNQRQSLWECSGPTTRGARCELNFHSRFTGYGPLEKCSGLAPPACGFDAVSTSSPFRFATSSHLADGRYQAVQWLIKRNCSVTPAQLVRLYISLCVVSLSIALFFWSQGARMIMPFAWLELLAVGLAFLVYARHARDGEKITLHGPSLVVELETGGRTERAEFSREWVRVEPRSGDGSLIQVSGQGRTVVVGRHLRPELRPALAREIRLALRGC